MKYFDWSADKNAQLKLERNMSFEEILVAIMDGGLLDILVHSNQAKYPDQKIFVVLCRQYVYLVPFMEDGDKVFLKTIIPSRKATRDYAIKSR